MEVNEENGQKLNTMQHSMQKKSQGQLELLSYSNNITEESSWNNHPSTNEMNFNESNGSDALEKLKLIMKRNELGFEAQEELRKAVGYLLVWHDQ